MLGDFVRPPLLQLTDVPADFYSRGTIGVQHVALWTTYTKQVSKALAGASPLLLTLPEIDGSCKSLREPLTMLSEHATTVFKAAIVKLCSASAELLRHSTVPAADEHAGAATSLRAWSASVHNHVGLGVVVF